MKSLYKHIKKNQTLYLYLIKNYINLNKTAIMEDDKYVFFFRSDINRDLLCGTDDRMDILKKIEDLKVLHNVEEVDILDEWDKLYDAIFKLWKAKPAKEVLMFQMPIDLFNKLAFFFDFIAQFFLHNGSDKDDPYLKLVDQFFKEYKHDKGSPSEGDLFKRAFK